MRAMRKTRRIAVITALVVHLVPTGSLGAQAVLRGEASWYDVEACRVNPDPACPTASGRSLYGLKKWERTTGNRFAAMWGVPFGTRIRVRNVENNREVSVVCLDRGPNRRYKRRVVDLSRAAFQDIADPRKGVIDVEVIYE